MIETDFKKYDTEPPEFGEIFMILPESPVSLQAKTYRKDRIKRTIQNKLKNLKFILSGDVKIEIEWLIHEEERYESPKNPDIDNIIKPILDGLSGRNGILIDDCQVQSITCFWVDWTKKEQQLHISIRYFPDEWLPKKNLRFVIFKNNLCWPIHKYLPLDVQKVFLDRFENAFEMREKYVQKNLDFYTSHLRGIMPIQRVFHKSRITDFENIDVSIFRKNIEKRMKERNQ